jgi:uncharacterized protein (TIGR03083 family)
MGWLDYERYETEFAAETSRLAGIASGLDPTRRVPTCPEWTVRDLVTHVGRGHRSATTVVEERLTGPPSFSTADAPDDPAAWGEWLTSGAGALVAAIRAAGADQPVWTWQRDRTAAFWLRRLLHDELVHRFDVEFTAGGPGPVAADLAADGVSDVLETAATLSRYTSRPTPFVALAGAGETLRFAATDHPAVWIAERTPEGVTWRPGDGAAAVTVRAPARELLLLLNRRLDPGHAEIEVTGDRALLDHWYEHTTF